MASTDDEVRRLRQVADDALNASRQSVCLTLLRAAFQSVPRRGAPQPPSRDVVSDSIDRFVEVGAYLQAECLLDRLAAGGSPWTQSSVRLLQLSARLWEARRTLTIHRMRPRLTREQFEQLPENRILAAEGHDVVYDTTHEQEVAHAAGLEVALGSTARDVVLNLGMLTETDIGAATQATVDAVTAAYRARDEGRQGASSPNDNPAAQEPPDGGTNRPAGRRPKANKKDDNRPSRERQDDILAAIRLKKTPLTRSEIIEVLKLPSDGKIGHNLAWMTKNHVLISIRGQGYWPADVPPPQ